MNGINTLKYNGECISDNPVPQSLKKNIVKTSTSPSVVKSEGDNKKQKKPKKKKKKRKKRCDFEGCNCKLDMLTWECKCGKKYCPTHKMSSSHNCSFDWRGNQAEYLNKNMEKGKSIDTRNFETLG